MIRTRSRQVRGAANKKPCHVSWRVQRVHTDWQMTHEDMLAHHTLVRQGCVVPPKRAGLVAQLQEGFVMTSLPPLIAKAGACLR